MWLQLCTLPSLSLVGSGQSLEGWGELNPAASESLQVLTALKGTVSTVRYLVYIETGLCLIFVEIYRLGDIRLGLNSIVEFNSVFFWFDSLVKVSCLPKGHIVTAFSLVQLLSCVWLFETPWIAEHQAFCPSPTPRACLNSCPLSQWCYPTISSSVVPFSSCLQSFPAWDSFPMSQLSHQVARVL